MRGEVRGEGEGEGKGEGDGMRVSAYSVESVVNNMFEVFAHPYLPHQFVLVPVHPRELADVGECVLQAISQLEGIHVAKAILDMGVNNQFCESEDFTAQMEGVAKAGLLPLL